MMANRTEYGLAAYFYTRDLTRAWRVAEELEFGEKLDGEGHGVFNTVKYDHNDHTRGYYQNGLMPYMSPPRLARRQAWWA